MLDQPRKDHKHTISGPPYGKQSIKFFKDAKCQQRIHSERIINYYEGYPEFYGEVKWFVHSETAL